MNSRRVFLGRLSHATTALAVTVIPSPRSTSLAETEFGARSDWIRTLRAVAEPVLEHLAANRLKEAMPVEAASGQRDNRRNFTHLEAVGRTLAGIAPGLELEPKPSDEVELGRRWVDLARRGLENAVNLGRPDHLDFNAGAQCLVDAAFLRAPQALWQHLPRPVQESLIQSFRGTRRIEPGHNNWLLFSAMIEVFLASVGGEWQNEPIAKAIRFHEEWYKGHGVYGDGSESHWDYYNSFVIHPFLIDVLEQIVKFTEQSATQLGLILRRARRYAAIQERMIGPDGSYPVVGRSIAYRCGAFQLLAQMALRRELPNELLPAQVRAALSA